MKRLLTVLLVVLAPAAIAQSVDERSPWEWSDRDRIAARLDDVAAAKRARDHNGRNSLGHVRAEGTADGPYDVIEGTRNPHLFFTFELFDQLILLAYSDDPVARDVYRESKDQQRVALGLPDDLWDRLESITAPYRGDRERERQVALSPSSRDEDHRRDWAMAASALCRSRSNSMREAHRQFGTAFERFLYTAVAPKMVHVVFRRPDHRLIRIVDGDCE